MKSIRYITLEFKFIEFNVLFALIQVLLIYKVSNTYMNFSIVFYFFAR